MNCGSEVSVDTKFCPSCSTSVAAEPKEVSAISQDIVDIFPDVPQIVESSESPQDCPSTVEWFIQIDKEPEGPFSQSDVVDMLATGKITYENLAFSEGLNGWTQIRELSQFPKSSTPDDASSDSNDEISLESNPNEKNTTKLLRMALFANPWSSVKTFFKDVKEYYRTIFKQIRHPAFSVKEGQGTYYGDIDLVKMSVSLYVTFVLAGMAITELSGKSTMGNMAVAGMNLLGLLVFFISIWCAMWIGRIWVKWAKPSFSRRQIDKMFVYESCLVFAMVLPLLLTDIELVLFVCWGLSFFHPFYMFFRINKVQATNILIRLCIGGMLTLGFSCSFLTQFAIGKITAADQDEIAAEGTTPTEESIEQNILENDDWE